MRQTAVIIIVKTGRGAQHRGSMTVCVPERLGRGNVNTTDVDVIVYVQKTGKLKPLYIVWEDPRSGEKTNYKIEKITYHLEMPSGNHTWHVVIQGQKRQLRYNGKIWQISSDIY